MNIFRQNGSILAIGSILMLLLLNACEKESRYEVLTGELIGYVTLHDSVQIYDHSGVEVVFEGSNPEIKAITDKDGRFSTTELQSGTYNLICHKEGYYQHKVMGYMFVGGNKPVGGPNIYLFGEVNTQIESVSLIQSEWSYSLEIYAQGKAANYSYRNNFIRYYLSDQPDVSYTNYLSTSMAQLGWGNEDFGFHIPVDTNIFPYDSRLYCIIYPSAEGYSQSYTDINTGVEIFTSINKNAPSDTTSLIITRNNWQ